MARETLQPCVSYILTTSTFEFSAILSPTPPPPFGWIPYFCPYISKKKKKKKNLGWWRSPPKSPISHSDLTHPIPNPTPEKALQKSVPPWGFSRPHLQLYKTWQPYVIPPLPPQGSPRSCSALLRLSLDLIWFITSVAASLLGDLNFSPPPAGPFPFPR